MRTEGPTIHSILCPVDLSPASGDVLRTALTIAQREQAHVTVVHILEPLLAQASAMAYDKAVLERMVSEDLQAIVEKTARRVGVPPHEVACSVRFGEPYEAILSAIDHDEPDLVVMGTQGFSGARKLFFGSTAARVLAKSTKPVLVVPPHAIDARAHKHESTLGLKHVVVAVDFSEPAMRAVEPAAVLARKWGLSLVLVHIVPTVPAVERWSEMLDEYQTRRADRARHELELIAREIEGVPVTVLSMTGTPEQAIAEIASKDPGTLIALGVQTHAQRRSTFGLGSTAYRLLCLSKRPVLIFPAPRAHEPSHNSSEAAVAHS